MPLNEADAHDAYCSVTYDVIHPTSYLLSERSFVRGLEKKSNAEFKYVHKQTVIVESDGDPSIPMLQVCEYCAGK